MRLLLVLLSILTSIISYSQTYTITGELQKWHKITIAFDGPAADEEATPNPFADYRLDVTFTNGSKTYIVPGYFAADGNAAETSSDSGSVWIVHFTPDMIGSWSFNTSFYEGADIAIGGTNGTEGILHGVTGNFNVVASDKTGRDHRGRGRLSYVGEHYLQFEEDSTWFFKAGADAPENTLAYEDMDDVPNRGNRRKNWQPHQQDYDPADAGSYTWQNGKGSELLGVVKYLADKGVNAFSFLTLSLHGDDENVFPHRLRVPVSTYNGYNDAQQWADGVYHDRFDVSRLAQWERIFSYADKKGLYMHFKTMETENDNMMDGNTFGRERKLYYRELIARFGHHLALNWNLTEETTLTDAVAIATSNYIADLDPYDHNIVLHTYPGQQTQRYTPLLGNNSSLTGASIQIGKNAVHDEVVEWVELSSTAGRKWIVANDEQGSANIGVDADPNDNDLVRDQVLWGTLMGGGAGVEYYYGYQTNGTDLTAQDHRTRDAKYTDAAYAIQYFDIHLQPYLPLINNQDDLTADNGDYAMTNATTMVTVYRPDGGTTAITLDPSSTWIVNWYNPRDGVMTYSNTPVSTTLTAPDNQAWVALITTDCPPIGTTCDDGNNATQNDTITAACTCVGDMCPVEGTPCDDNDATTVDDEEDGNCNCTGIARINIPGRVEAENTYVNNGTIPEPCSDTGGGENLGFINDGDNVTYKVEITNAGPYNIIFRVASDTNGGTITYTAGPDTGVVTVGNTTGWQTWEDVIIADTFLTTGPFDLELVFAGGAGSLFNLNYIDFVETGCIVGAPCDDNDSNTNGDIYDSNCICRGTPIIPSSPLLEAEDAIYGSQWTRIDDTEACGFQYLLPPNLTAYTTAPSTAADLVTFTFNTDNAGDYKVYARTLTTNDADDSFWVRANNGTWQKWNKINAPNYPTGYQWSQVGNWISGDNAVPVTFALNAGINTIDFAWREPGARLDKIFVTEQDLSILNLVQITTSEDPYSFQSVISEACPNDTIRFALATDNLPIIPTSNLVTIDKPLVIIGNGPQTTLLDGNGQYQLFINISAILSIHNLKMSNGHATDNGGAFINDGEIWLHDVILEGNTQSENQNALTNNGIIRIVSGNTEIKE